MIALLDLLLQVVRVLLAQVLAMLVPQPGQPVTLVHVAAWVPVVLGLLTLVLRLRGRTRVPAALDQPAAAAKASKRLKRPAKGQTPLARHRAQQRAERAAQERAEQAQRQALREREQAARAAQREQERAEQARQREQEQAERAERAALLQQQRAERAQQREQERAERARLREQEQAQRTQRAALLQQQRAERAQQRERERADRAQRAALLQQQRAERAALKAQEQAQRKAERARLAAERAQQREQERAARRLTRAFGSDPSRVYEFRYRVVSLDELITSNTDTGAVNPLYDRTLQPRARDRAASQLQIERVARGLIAESYLLDFHQLDKGAPIVGDDLQVESGNGRVLALRKARAEFQDNFADYQAKLRRQLKEYGISAREVAGVKDPVLVRERVSAVDRASFAREANSPPVLQMSTLEQAQIDARQISDAMILKLKVREEQSIDQALRQRANSDFVRAFMGTLSDNEQAVLMRANGTLSQNGIWRIKGAVFARVFPGEAGRRLADTFLESLDSSIKNFENGISATLPALARAESLIAAGERPSVSLVADFATALDMLARLREQEIAPQVYVEQSSMFERELTPLQERILLDFDAMSRKPKAVREFMAAYAQAVEELQHPDQASLFGQEPMTAEELYRSLATRPLKLERKAA